MLRRLSVAVVATAALMGAVALPATAAEAAPHASHVVAADASVIEVTKDNYQDVLEMSKEKPVVLDFMADWCGPCKQQKPYLKKFHKADHGKWIWAKVNVDANKEISDEWNVEYIPTLVNVQDSKEAGSRQVGFDGPEELRTWLDAL